MSILNLLPLKLGFAYLHFSIMAPVEIVYFLAIVATTFNSLVMAGYNEYVDMLLVLGECRMNNTAAARVYAQRFPHRRGPSRREFPALVRRARQTGRLSAYPIRCQIYRPYRNEVNIINVLATVEAFPHKSIREIARDTGLSNTTIFRIMKDHNLRAYKMSFHQALQPSDWEKRLRFCHWAQRRLAQDPQFFRNVLWTDESTFCSTGEVNHHNFRYWSETNPHWVRIIDDQHRFKVNVWCGIYQGRIIGPHFFEETLNGAVFYRFLNEEFLNLIEDIPLAQRNTMWLQLDGCPSHYSINVRSRIKEMFPERSIGRGLHIEWPPRSPDLTVMDYFLWGRLKDIVYQEMPQSIEDMKNKIKLATSSISVAEIESAERNFRDRLLKCINEEGRIFEHL